MVDHICEPMPSTGSHFPNYAARCKMGERHRLQNIRAVSALITSSDFDVRTAGKFAGFAFEDAASVDISPLCRVQGGWD
jgi:hypothetical protein